MYLCAQISILSLAAVSVFLLVLGATIIVAWHKGKKVDASRDSTGAGYTSYIIGGVLSKPKASLYL